MRFFECSRYFLDLACCIIRTKIDSSTNCYGTKVPCISYRTKHDLISLVWIREKFVVSYLGNEWNSVRVLARHHRKNTIGSSHTVTSAFDRKFNDVVRIEIRWVFSE